MFGEMSAGGGGRTPDGSIDFLHILDLAFVGPLENVTLLVGSDVYLGRVGKAEPEARRPSVTQGKIIFWERTMYSRESHRRNWAGPACP